MAGKFNKILIDISKTPSKVYGLTSDTTQLLPSNLQYSYISANKSDLEIKKYELYKVITQMQKNYHGTPIEVFSKEMHQKKNKPDWKDFINEVYLSTGVTFSMEPGSFSSFIN
jgi:hypothetical protein